MAPGILIRAGKNRVLLHGCYMALSPLPPTIAMGEEALVCTCVSCSAFVGASSSRLALMVVELAHRCSHEIIVPPVSGNQPAALPD